MEIIREALDLKPSETRRFIATMVLYNLDNEDVYKALPRRVEPHLIFADFLHRTGYEDEARETYLNALQHVENEKTMKKSFFLVPYEYLVKRGLQDDALKIMVRATEFLPEDLAIRLKAAEAYERVGITYRAREEYEKALILDPQNRTAREKLGSLGQ
jgi:Tfp pilus assembly protein PilF